MLSKIKNLVINFIKNLGDLRFLGQSIFVIIVILVSWSTASSIQANFELQQRVVKEQKENELQKLKNENLKIKNKYLETDEFLELAARKQLGKGDPGETLVIVPKATALRYTVPGTIKSDEELQKKAEENKPWYQQNLEAWGQFFFRS